jgi:hypothetical protein
MLSSPALADTAKPKAPEPKPVAPARPATGFRFIREELRTVPAPYPDAPADPWAAVSKDQPVRMSEDVAFNWRVRTEETSCTAAHDHCLAPGTWLMELDGSRDGTLDRTAIALGFGPTGTVTPGNVRVDGFGDEVVAYTAYRTVPATKKNLVPGALIMVFGIPQQHFVQKAYTNGWAAYSMNWNVGVVESVDWDSSFVTFVGNSDPWFISSTRVAVLSWRPGGKVSILRGAKRDQLAVKASDVILP